MNAEVTDYPQGSLLAADLERHPCSDFQVISCVATCHPLCIMGFDHLSGRMMFLKQAAFPHLIVDLTEAITIFFIY